jgi:hypothetical protein
MLKFGISYIEALDSIEDGLVKGGQTNGEFLESMRGPLSLLQQDIQLRIFKTL